MKTTNLRKVHNADMSLGTEEYLQLCTVIGEIFENDEDDKFYNRVQFQSSNNGGFWSINIAAFSLPLFLEFLSEVYVAMPVTEENTTVVESVDLPPVVPLDETLEGVQTLVPEMDTEDETDEQDEDEEEDSEEPLEATIDQTGYEATPGGITRKKRLLKPVTTQKVATGVTVEGFDEDAE